MTRLEEIRMRLDKSGKWHETDIMYLLSLLEEKDQQIEKALELILRYGDIGGDHHKMWVIDQVVRILADDYKKWVRNACDGEDGPDTYGWDEGIAP